VTEIAVAGDEASLTGALQKALSPTDYQVQRWDEIAPDVRQIIELNDATMQLLVLIVFAIVALGIANTMGMAIFERFREFGILSAIGTTPRTVLTLVLLESLYLGLIASVAGSALGLAACLYLGKYGVDLSTFTSANQYMAISHVLKARLVGMDIGAANVLTIVTSVLAGCFPAFRASRMKPVDAITHH
jgi:ABC-type lipoprotein release transport system permease subunit